MSLKLPSSFTGTVSFPNNSYVRAVRSGNQTLSDSGSTTLIFNNETADRNSEYNPASGVFTAAADGVYVVTVGLVMSNSSAVTRVQLNIIANGAPHQVLDLAGGTIRSVGGASAVAISAGQTISVSAFTQGTSVVADSGTTYLTIAKVS